MPFERVIVKIPSKRLKQEYRRSCQLLGVSMSAGIHQTIRTTIRKAKDRFPQEFNLLTEDEQLVIEALEAEQTTVSEIQMYARFEKTRVLELLQSLIAAGHVREHTSEPRSYTPIHK